jgi:hypothetical protein
VEPTVRACLQWQSGYDDHHRRNNHNDIDNVNHQYHINNDINYRSANHNKYEYNINDNKYHVNVNIDDFNNECPNHNVHNDNDNCSTDNNDIHNSARIHNNINISASCDYYFYTRIATNSDPTNNNHASPNNINYLHFNDNTTNTGDPNSQLVPS